MKFTSTLLISTLALCSLAQTPEKCDCKDMPKFSLKATDGKTYTPESMTKGATVVVLLKAGCPHNPISAPELNKLKKQLTDKVMFVAVTDLDPSKVKAYAKELKLDFPLIADPEKRLMKGFGGSHSLDIAVLCPHDKKVAKLFDGYDQKTIAEIFTMLPSHGGPKLTPHLSAFSKKKVSGCGF